MELQLINEQEVLGKKFRIYGDYENPLFLAKDVAEWIDYDKSSVNKMLSSVDEEEKTTRKIIPNGTNYKTEAWFLTENGVYEVLMQSRKPIAKEFKKKVKHILKSIRVNGGYIKNQEISTPEQILANAVLVAQNVIAQKDKQIEEMKPKAEFYDAVAGSKNALTMEQVAKVLDIPGIGRNKLFEILRNMKILQNNNIPYQKYIDRGYFRIAETKYQKANGEININIRTYVHQKGVDFIRKQIQKNTL